MKQVEKLLKLDANLKITKIERENGNNIIYIENKKNKVRCTIFNEFTKSIHDRLKPIKIKDLKIYEEPTILYIHKRRFICYKCKKRFVEELNINSKNESLSKKLKFKIQQDLLNYNLSLKYIAETNNVSENTIRSILKEAMKNHPKYLKNLPRVISMDEFKADTNGLLLKYIKINTK